LALHFALLAPQHYTSSIKGFRDTSTLIDLIALRENTGASAPGGQSLSATGRFCGEALKAVA
jgi:hypothetical protein